VALGIVLFIIAVIYLTQPANALPGFLPGANAASSAKHMKHGIAAAGLGALLFVGAWMTTGSKKSS